MNSPVYVLERLLGIGIACLLGAPGVRAQAPVEKSFELSGGGQLLYVERVPAPDAVSTPRRLFVCLAPGSGDASMVQAARQHLGRLAGDAGYLTLYPISTTGGFTGAAADGVIELVEHVLDEHAIDPSLVVLAGLSNGGRAVFDVATRAPALFAALIAAPGSAAAQLDLSVLAGKPVWMRVGGTDSEGWREQARETVERLELAGARVDHAVIDEQGHVLALGDQGLLEWLDRTLAPARRRVQFPAPDGLPIEAELYGSEDRSRPIIVLCHQAGSSRGEYRVIAPRLVEAGYTCLAIDQRSGGAMNDVQNQTAQRAEALLRDDPERQGQSLGYLDARVDIEAALDWIREAGFDGPLALWGSSYSASLALAIGAERGDLAALLSFSPGEYFGDELQVAQAAARVTCPVLVVSPESERAQSEPLVEALTPAKTYVVAEGILHGSKTLWKGTQSDQVWEQVLAFLDRNLRSEGDD